MPGPEARYTEKQIAAILRRAAEIQAEGGKASDAPGLSESELVQIGGELGLEPASIRAAIAEHEAGGDPQVRNYPFGGPTQVEMERSFEAELTDEAWESIVALFRRTFSKVGSVNVVGGVREWSGGERELDSLHMSARQKGNTLHVRVLSNLGAAAFLIAFLFVFPLLLCIIGASTAKELEIWARAVLSSLIALSGFGVWRWLYGSMCRRRERVMKEILAKLNSMLPARRQTVEAIPATMESGSEAEAPLRLGDR